MNLEKKLLDPSGRAAKFVFTDKDSVTEVSGCKYEGRGVVCFSVMSGCPVGCSFCGTGKRFIRSLQKKEMLEQIATGLNWVGKQEKTQIMSMSMGEPMLNMIQVGAVAEEMLGVGYEFYMSTVGIKSQMAVNRILEMAGKYPGFSLQFSLHSPFNAERRQLLGNYPKLMDIEEIREFAGEFNKKSGKPAYFNFICRGEENESTAKMVAYVVGNHHLTCSVLSNTSGLEKPDPAPANRFAKMCGDFGVKDLSVSNCIGQDTIGGGCGQLLFVQEFLSRGK